MLLFNVPPLNINLIKIGDFFMERLILKSVQKPAKRGRSYYFNVQKIFIDEGELVFNKNYEVEVYSLQGDREQLIFKQLLPLSKIGDLYYFNIQKKYIEDKLIDTEQAYSILVYESKNSKSS